jgi:hypothetical protein
MAGTTGDLIDDEDEGGGGGGATPHRSDTSNTPLEFPTSKGTVK